jgi:hypothetical protein
LHRYDVSHQTDVPPNLIFGQHAFSLLRIHADRIRGVRGSIPKRTSGQHPHANMLGDPLLYLLRLWERFH